jgi:outer membrane protein assembly factor BamA
MNPWPVLATLFFFASSAFCQTAHPSDSSHTPDLTQYQLGAINFVGNRVFSQEQLRGTFNVPVGGKFEHTAVGRGLERLRSFYGDRGYINFTAVPTLQVNQVRGTVGLTVSIQEGAQFHFGQLFLVGRETRAGEADALRKAWVALSGKTFSSSLLSRWLSENATFLPKDGQPPLRHVELHQSIDTRQADIAIPFPSPKS